MLPLSEVTVTVARSIGTLSGPMMRPRMTSLCARATVGRETAAAKSAATRNAMRRRLTVKPEVWEGSDTLKDAGQPGY